MKSFNSADAHYFDRDLSWLSFNYRVLMEAKNQEVQLYDRIKFLGIYSSNLDEFFRVRVASIKSLAAIDKKKIRKKLDFEPEQLLEQILAIVTKQQNDFGKTYQKNIIPGLRKENIILYQKEKLTQSQLKFIKDFFLSKVLSYLQPVILSPEREHFLKNRQLYLIVDLFSKDQNVTAYLNIPSEMLPRFVALPASRGKNYFIYLDDLIRLNLSYIFPGYTIQGSYSMKLNRDAELYIEDEYSGNLIEKISKNLSKRNVGTPSRFLYDHQMPEDLLKHSMKVFGISEHDCVEGGRYHNLHDLMKLPNPRKPDLEGKQFSPLPHTKIDACESIFQAIDQGDQMLHFPYHSYDYVLRFFNEAAIHPNVKEIKVTLYRIAKFSFIANALISAARNGKKVCVFLEIKARFDEENNLKWAKEMEEAGVKILYSMPGLKVHAKIAYIKMKKDGQNHEYAYLGTGNFNEVTAGIYADHALLTAHQGIVKDLKQVFSFLEKQKPIAKLDHLMVAQSNMIERLMALIAKEMENAQAGKKANMIIKLNNLEEKEMIDKLYEASQAGVQIQLIIRGICCLIPGVKGLSDNIKVIRLVDQYLEHARIFIFHNDGNELFFLSSADWMGRNLHRRIEVGFPIYEEEIKKEIKTLITFQLSDNTKACLLDQKLSNHYINNIDQLKKVRAQSDFYFWLKNQISHR